MTRTSTVTPDNVKLPSGKWGTDSGYVIGKIIPGI